MTPPADIDQKTAELFWTLANLVCGFAVAQMIAYMMAAGSSQSTIADGVKAHWKPILWAISGATIAYGGLLYYFAYCHWTLLNITADNRLYCMLWWTAIARILAVASINGVGALVTYVLAHPKPQLRSAPASTLPASDTTHPAVP